MVRILKSIKRLLQLQNNVKNRREVTLSLQRRSKQTKATGWKSKRPTKNKFPSSIATSLNKRNNHSKQRSGIMFGLRPVDYSTAPSLIIAPAPPPPKPGLRKYFFPMTLFATFGTTAYFYFNNQNDSYEYWSAMQTGGIYTYDEDEDEDEDENDDNYDDGDKK